MTDLAEARVAYDAREWSRAAELYAARTDLSLDDLDRYAVSLMLLGRADDYFAIRERAYEQALEVGDLPAAAMAAFWSGMQRMVMGAVAEGGGWLSRCSRVVAEDGGDSLAAAFLLASEAFEAQFAGDHERSLRLVERAVDEGRRHGCADLVALALHQQGLLLLEWGRTRDGLARLDEAMVEVASGRPSQMVSGIVYCGVIAGCWSAYELRRAQQWTAAMSDWCAGQPDLANFTGECKVRRAELHLLRGEWAEAFDELAGVSPADVDPWAAGTSAYLRGNLARLQGRFDSAEECFALASRLGIDPQPGLALVRLAQGSVQAAAAMARRCLAESHDDARRVDVLAAGSEILLAAGEHDAARTATDELTAMAARLRSPVVTATAQQGTAMLLLGSGRADEALVPARAAITAWVQLKAPYHEARARLLVAEACRLLGDRESADREHELAVARFTELGAVPDLARAQGARDLLSPRELEVLRLVATGATNRAIAERLVLSQRTVDRHVSNIFVKLGVSTRAAATAYAFERQLV